MKIRLLFLLLLSSVSGCVSPGIYSNMEYKELESYKAAMSIEDGKLIVSLDNIRGLMVSEIIAERRDEVILVGAHRISSGGGKRTYEVIIPRNEDRSGLFKRISWLNPDGTSHDLYPKYIK